MAIVLNFKRIGWLAACLVLALACHQSCQSPATSIFDPGSLGISFRDVDPGDGTSRGPKLQLLGRAVVGPSIAEGMEERNGQESGPRITGGQFLRPRSQATSKELLRRRHIAELLNALADNIPKQKKQEPKRQQQQQQQSPAAQRTAAEMPIYRNSRTFPSAGASYRPGSDQLLTIGSWPLDESGQVVGGRGTTGGNLRESRKANFATTGIVWGATPDGQPTLQRVWPSAGLGAGSASPPFFSQHTANAAAASTKNARARTRPVAASGAPAISSGELAQLTANSLDGYPEPVRQQQQQQQQRHHLRSGNEEVPLHTPEHSSPSSDYEWKRVENSRNSWNNLRGMWGKRSPPQPSPGDDDGDDEGLNNSGTNNPEGEQDKDLWLLAGARQAGAS